MRRLNRKLSVFFGRINVFEHCEQLSNLFRMNYYVACFLDLTYTSQHDWMLECKTEMCFCIELYLE